MTSIYALQDPDTGEFFLVGAGKDARARLNGHISAAKAKTPTNNLASIRILRLLLAGKRPTVTTLEEAPEGNWEWRESYWINRLRKEGTR